MVGQAVRVGMEVSVIGDMPKCVLQVHVQDGVFIKIQNEPRREFIEVIEAVTSSRHHMGLARMDRPEGLFIHQIRR